MSTEPYTRTPWMTEEIRRIARKRFDRTYWPAIEAALLNCLESHTVVLKAPNKDKQIAAFVLVCPPLFANRSAYGIDSKVPTQSLEIAFVATDDGWEGHGFARALLEAVLFRCKTAQQSVWLHVDTINEKAHGFYERLGFRDFLHIPDPFGSPGTIMLYGCGQGQGHPKPVPKGHDNSLEWPALFNAPPCETEQPLRRGILPPPRLTCY